MEQCESQIKRLVSSGATYKHISEQLQQANPGTSGLSERSVRRFCQRKGISYRSHLDDQQVDQVVEGAIQEVGNGYGRRMMHGLLSSRHLHVSQSRIGASLQRVSPYHYTSRRLNSGVRQIQNPSLYRAYFYGQKLHCDQNEKLAMYRVTHVIAVDGFSRKVVRCITIPVKNPIAIYDLMFRPILVEEGVWDQVRVDHGTEFFLILAVQDHLAHLRTRQDHQPFMQTTSTNNHRVERLWPEINRRVNYPIKEISIDMEASGSINMQDETTKFCVSWTTIQVASVGLVQFIQAWNSHRIDGPNGGVPNRLADEHHNTTQVAQGAIPSVNDAVTLYESSGGHLSRNSLFGVDPLAQHPQEHSYRIRDFCTRYGSFEQLYCNVSSGNGDEFKRAILYFRDLTQQYTLTLSH